jgi:hypothetical protein
MTSSSCKNHCTLLFYIPLHRTACIQGPGGGGVRCEILRVSWPYTAHALYLVGTIFRDVAVTW